MIRQKTFRSFTTTLIWRVYQRLTDLSRMVKSCEWHSGVKTACRDKLIQPRETVKWESLHRQREQKFSKVEFVLKSWFKRDNNGRILLKKSMEQWTVKINNFLLLVCSVICITNLTWNFLRPGEEKLCRSYLARRILRSSDTSKPIRHGFVEV